MKKFEVQESATYPGKWWILCYEEKVLNYIGKKDGVFDRHLEIPANCQANSSREAIQVIKRFFGKDTEVTTRELE